MYDNAAAPQLHPYPRLSVSKRRYAAGTTIAELRQQRAIRPNAHPTVCARYPHAVESYLQRIGV
jgi:hypothetical protein